MDKTIEIDGREVKFRATARTPRLYRMIIGRDMIIDMNNLIKAYEKAKKTDESLDIISLQTFEDVSYVMARHADPDIEQRTPEEWLDTFNMFSIFTVLPQTKLLLRTVLIITLSGNITSLCKLIK